jgi:hypothetical protein
MKAVLTQEQIDALMAVIRAINSNSKLTSDLYDIVRAREAIENIREVFSQQEDNEV